MHVEWRQGLSHYILGGGLPPLGEGRLWDGIGRSKAEALLRGACREAGVGSRLRGVLAAAGAGAAKLDDAAVLAEAARLLSTGAMWLLDVSQGPDAQVQPAGGAGWDAGAAADHLRAHKEPKSLHRCAAYVRRAIMAGGVELRDWPGVAKNYGPFLLKFGFAERPADAVDAKGDVVVIQPYAGGNPAGHIAMYDGKAWISDFEQRDFWGGPKYRTLKPAHVFYRHP